jgi:hypothetical protein
MILEWFEEWLTKGVPDPPWWQWIRSLPAIAYVVPQAGTSVVPMGVPSPLKILTHP